MKHSKLILMAFIAFVGLLLFPVINGLGCDFSFKYMIDDREEFGSCKLGQYTLIEYPDKDNGYTVLNGLYFNIFNNAVIVVTSHEDHTKKMTPEVMSAINVLNQRSWYQMSMEQISPSHMAVYTDTPSDTMKVIQYKGKLSLLGKDA
ncbi:hypothetical protein [Photobacterium profundum]|uniref:hypothetical protein n=1 Tax=Photobacterium profundum TaxID=74109 RepID=UPI00031545AC|nr:hypothetical protein [Photobacterium profundum]